MRLVHLSDAHWWYPPTRWTEYLNKRLLATANWFLLNRKSQLSPRVRQALIRSASATPRDGFVFTGDASCTGTQLELQVAASQLDCLREGGLVVSGNHDEYLWSTRGKLYHVFDRWNHPRAAALAILPIGDVTVIGIDSCYPCGWSKSSGRVPQAHLRLLEAESCKPGKKILALHYPVIDKDGELYHRKKPRHGLENADELMQILESTPFPPRLIIHGHLHYPFNVERKGFLFSTPGTCAGCTKEHLGSFHVYDVNGSRVDIHRYSIDLSSLHASELILDHNVFSFPDVFDIPEQMTSGIKSMLS
jgi:3',5'-cyclic AMP phosphodiesterase CpdA